MQNVRFVFGKGSRPVTGKGSKHDDGDQPSECLVNVYATMPIKEGAELVGDYGSQYWDNILD